MYRDTKKIFILISPGIKAYITFILDWIIFKIHGEGKLMKFNYIPFGDCSF